MYRKFIKKLQQWESEKIKEPLLVIGARQVGKTESILQFARANYSNIIYINFVLDTKFTKIVSDGYSVEAVIRNISLVDPSITFKEHDTLLVFDEIQEYPDIATSLKAFALDKRYDVICSGSMLGINYKRIHSTDKFYL